MKVTLENCLRLAGLAVLAAGLHEAAAQTCLSVGQNAGKPQVLLKGVPGTTNQIQWTADLRSTNTWTVITNIVLDSYQSAAIPDPHSSNATRRFYRALVTGGPPTNPNPAELIWIPPGTFMMGSPAGELDRYSNEGPQTRVTITRGFWMAKYPVTQLQYYDVMKASPSHYPGTYLPVDSVTWGNATNYCGKLTQIEMVAGRLPTNYVYRLATEGEREYATRAGTTTRFSYGDDLTYTDLAKYAWFATNYLASSHLIGQKLPNPWGLYDLHANVMEWCLDYLGSTLPGGQLTDPNHSSSTTRRTLRGGSMASQARDCRSAFRLWDDPTSTFINGGFRVILAPPLP